MWLLWLKTTTPLSGVCINILRTAFPTLGMLRRTSGIAFPTWGTLRRTSGTTFPETGMVVVHRTNPFLCSLKQQASINKARSAAMCIAVGVSPRIPALGYQPRSGDITSQNMRSPMPPLRGSSPSGPVRGLTPTAMHLSALRASELFRLICLPPVSGRRVRALAPRGRQSLLALAMAVLPQVSG